MDIYAKLWIINDMAVTRCPHRETVENISINIY